MNKKLIALALFTVVAEQGTVLASECLAAPQPIVIEANNDCCPAPRPSCCPRVRKMRSCCPRRSIKRNCCKVRRCRTSRIRRIFSGRRKRGCCPVARCCRPKAPCCPAPAPVCEAPACEVVAPVETCASTVIPAPAYMPEAEQMMEEEAPMAEMAPVSAEAVEEEEADVEA